MSESASPWWRSAPIPWVMGSVLIALFVLAPIAALGLAASRGSADLWQHLLAYVLPVALRDTIVLLTGVGALTAAIGTTAAWLVTAYDFRGRRVLEWALVLPLAVPTYIIAYTYLDLLHPVGPVQTALRELMGIESPRDLRLPDVRSMAGCILLLGFVLYPYVYLTTRAMFLLQAANLIDVARTLGTGRRGVFFRVALPLARPAVAVGLSLALMEALNDIGASEFLGVRTLTVSIYSTWVTRADLPGAAQIALAMLLVVVCLVSLERWGRRRRRYANDAQHPRPLARHRLTGMAGVGALALGFLPVFVGFVAPATYLIDETISRLRFAGVPRVIVSETINTLGIAALATTLTVICGIFVAYTLRVSRGGLAEIAGRISTLGYAVPGTVLAIGLLPVVTGFDGLIDVVTHPFVGAATGLFLLGSGVAVVYAYVVRFLAVAVNGVESGFARLPASFDAAARTLGESATGRLWRIHIPLTRPAIASAALLVFVDCMKELPATLLLRPIGFETLATHLYGEAARGTYEDAAIAALLIVAAGLLPALLLGRMGQQSEGGTRGESGDLVTW